MRKSSSSSTGLGDLMVAMSFLALSVVAGVAVAGILMVMAWPVVAVFPVDSGANEIVTALALLWGIIAGCVVAVLTLGPWRRLQSHARVERFDDADALPLEMIGRPIASRRHAANDIRGYDEDELLLEEEATPRRRVAQQPKRYRRAS